MGYLTYYKMQVVPEEKLIEVYNDLPGFDSIDEGDLGWLEEDGMFMGEPTTWYDCEKDIVAAAEKHPDVLIILDGEGEEQGDIWRAFARGDKFEIYHAPKWIAPDKPLFDYDEGDCC